MDRKLYIVFNRNCFPKMKDFPRLGDLQAVTYTVKVVHDMNWRERHAAITHH